MSVKVLYFQKILYLPKQISGYAPGLQMKSDDMHTLVSSF